MSSSAPSSMTDTTGQQTTTWAPSCCQKQPGCAQRARASSCCSTASARFDPRVLEIAAAHNVHMLAFPPHSTHILQPLDVGIMQPLKHHYTQVRQLPNRNL